MQHIIRTFTYTSLYAIIQLIHMKTLTLTLPFSRKRSVRITSGVAAGSVALAFTIISASTFPVFGKQLTGVFSPLSLLFVSEIMGGIFVMLSFGFIPLIQLVWKLKYKQKMYLLFCGIITGVISPYMWFLGLSQTTAINAELFSRAEAIFLIGFSAIFLRESISRKQISALSIIFLGVAYVALKGFSVGFALQIGDMLIIASSFLYAIGGIIVKKYLHNVHPEAIIIMRAFLATLLFVIFSVFLTHNVMAELKNMDSTLITVLLCYGFITKFLGIYCFHEAIERLKIATVSMIGTLSIVGGMAFAAMYLGESIHSYQIIGGTLVVVGVVLMQYFGVHSTPKAHKHHIRSHHRNRL